MVNKQNKYECLKQKHNGHRTFNCMECYCKNSYQEINSMMWWMSERSKHNIILCNWLYYYGWMRGHGMLVTSIAVHSFLCVRSSNDFPLTSMLWPFVVSLNFKFSASKYVQSSNQFYFGSSLIDFLACYPNNYQKEIVLVLSTGSWGLEWDAMIWLMATTMMFGSNTSRHSDGWARNQKGRFEERGP